jgi:hypothetical protein
VQEALTNLDLCIAERQARLDAFLRERGIETPELAPTRTHPCPLVLSPGESDDRHVDHIEWVRTLPEADSVALGSWLAGIVRDVASR